MSDVGPIQYAVVDSPGGLTTQVSNIASGVQAGEPTPVQEVVGRAEGKAYPRLS